MHSEFAPVFTHLKTILAKHAPRLAVKADTPAEYTLVTQSPSPFPQHKGQPMWFGCVRIGKAYVSVHLLPLYMNPALCKTIPPALKKRMQGKACFNFKTAPDAEQTSALASLTEAAVQDWRAKKWL
jgi:hypothetical protein